VTVPQAPRSYLDENNPLLSGVPARLDTGAIGLPAGAGTAGVVTVRTASTTVTVILTAAELDTWAGVLRNLASTVREAPVLARPTPAETFTLAKGNGRLPAG
jgi:hypothetical protein